MQNQFVSFDTQRATSNGRGRGECCDSTKKTFKSLREERQRVAGNAKQQQRNVTSMSLYREEESFNKPWQLSDTLGLNSTTLRFLFNIRDEVGSFWAKFEAQATRFRLIVVSKVERDLRTVGLTSDYVARRASKETERIVSTIVSSTPNMLALPSSIQSLAGNGTSSGGEAWTLMRSGLNPLEIDSSPRLLGRFDATNTRQRVQSFRKKQPSSQRQTGVTSSPDALYRSVKLLPNKLKYDYERRRVAQEGAKQAEERH